MRRQPCKEIGTDPQAETEGMGNAKALRQERTWHAPETTGRPRAQGAKYERD